MPVASLGNWFNAIKKSISVATPPARKEWNSPPYFGMPPTSWKKFQKLKTYERTFWKVNAALSVTPELFRQVIWIVHSSDR